MKSSTFANDLLLLLFNNIAIAGLGDTSGLQPSAAYGNFYISLHTADPGVGGSQTTSEVPTTNYPNYARIGVTRNPNGSGWTVSTNQVSNTALISFAQCTGSGYTVTHWAVGTAASGAGLILYSGPLISTYFDFTAATNGNLTIPGVASGLAVDDTVQVISMPNGTLPTGISAGTTYYVKSVSGETITLSTTKGGSLLTYSATGAGAIGKIGALAVSNLITPQFAASSLVVVEY